MITLNLSPETKVGVIIDKTDNDVTIKHVNGQTFTLSKDNFVKFIKKEEIAISKAKVLFSQKQKGIIPETVDHYYEKRVALKKQFKVVKKKLSILKKDDPEYIQTKNQSDNLNIQQHTIKILINTIYGYFGNKHSPLGDDELAESITLTGQAVIKHSNKLLIDYIKSKANLTDQDITNDTPIIYNDTDSSYISIKALVKQLNIKMLNKNGKITDEYYKTVQDIEDYLNTEIKKWGATALNSTDCRLMFKREVIADVGLFLQKKRYVLHILDEEGIPCDKFKYTGVEVVRTTMPKAIKPHVKRIIETMLMTKSLTETNKAFTETYDLFKGLSIDEIAFVMGCKGYEKYAAQCDNFSTAKHMPIHVKAAYYHNLLLDKFKLDKKYEKISSGDKVRFFYVRQPNRYGLSILGYKYYFPKEFIESFEPDREKMFEKIIFSVMERFYEAVNWKLTSPGSQVQTDLFELLGA
jgi:DNA polymerase elongation subunit (family B)